MTDLSAHRGTASALLAAGVAAIVVIGGATAIVHARGAAPAAGASATAIATPLAPAAARRLHPAKKVAVKGLRKWHAASLPKRLQLKPVVQHPHRVVTVVKTVPVAVAPATTARASRTARPAKQRPAAETRAWPRGGQALPVVQSGAPVTSPPALPSAPSAPATGAPVVPQTPAPAPSAPVTTAPPAPPAPPSGPTGRVAIAGSKTQGQTLTATWTGADPAATAYQWQLCDRDGQACQPIAGETNQTYTVKTTDVGLTLRVVAVSAGVTSTSRATDQIETGG